MRILKYLATAAAVASLASAPVVAQASGAAKLSLRASTKAKNSSQISPVATLLFLGVFVGGIVFSSEGGFGSDSP
ncbi:MAG: hypothetical protein EOP61_00115 [Sphingomonadales bacterium]|nr:MAG: hypothetical protein EOP61_00115 [Sphingomonadales bacterium]